MTYIDTKRYIFDGTGRILVRIVFPHSREVEENTLGWMDQEAGKINLDDGRTISAKEWIGKPVTQREREKGWF